MNRLLTRVRLLLIAAVLAIVGAGEAWAQTYYLFDDFLDTPYMTLTDPDGDGWFTGQSSLATAKTNTGTFVISDSSTAADNANYFGSSEADAAVTVSDGAELAVVMTTHDDAYGTRGCFKIPDLSSPATEAWQISFNPTLMKARFNIVEADVAAPARLYVVNCNKSFGNAQKDENNVYTFKGVKLNSDWKDYGFADMGQEPWHPVLGYLLRPWR